MPSFLETESFQVEVELGKKGILEPTILVVFGILRKYGLLMDSKLIL